VLQLLSQHTARLHEQSMSHQTKTVSAIEAASTQKIVAGKTDLGLVARADFRMTEEPVSQCSLPPLARSHYRLKNYGGDLGAEPKGGWLPSGIIRSYESFRTVSEESITRQQLGFVGRHKTAVGTYDRAQDPAVAANSLCGRAEEVYGVRAGRSKSKILSSGGGAYEMLSTGSRAL
jgi:hypothetical protein